MTPRPAASGVAAEAPGADLREHGARIERLMDEVRGMAGPSTWPRVEELLRLVVELYGAGLAHLLAHALEVAEPAGAALAERLARDELLASLLLLHGLHPVPTRERVERAVERLRAELGTAGEGLELRDVSDDGVARLRLAAGASRGGCPSARGGLARAAEQAVLEAAPELLRVEIEEPGEAAPHAGRLVTIGPPRPHPVTG